jgi:hypothetical protein
MTDANVGPRTLDEEVAVRLFGYRWVQWNNRSAGVAPSEERGRFLAPPDGLLSHLQVPAGLEVPLAEDPFRYLPAFSDDLSAAFEAARSVGLLETAHAILDYAEPGEWSVRTREGKALARGPSLPEVICRASLSLSDTSPHSRAG